MWGWLQTELGNDAWTRAFVALVDVAAKGMVLMALAGIAASAMRRASAAARHLVWMLALIGLLLLPAFSVVMPKWQLPVLPSMAAPSVDNTPAASRTTVIVPEPIQGTAANVDQPVPVVSPASESHLELPRPAPAPPAPLAPSVSTAFWLVVTWLVMTISILTPLLAGHWAVGRLRRKASRFPNDGLQHLALSLAESLRLRRPVAILRAGPGAMPMAAGLLRSALFLPDEAEDWPAEKQRAVLLHELAHVKRRDCLTHAVARLATALHWFNPLAWLALRRLRIERERACDDLVLTAGERPSDYAGHLLDVARTMRAGMLTSTAAITMAKKSQLEGRLSAVLDPRRNRKAITRWTVTLSALVLLAVAVPLGVMGLGVRVPGNDATPSYDVTFASGVRATVLGVGEPGDDPNRKCWGPSGASLPNVPPGFEDIGATVTPGSNEVAREFYVEILVPLEADDVNVKWRIDGKGGAGGSSRSEDRIRLGVATTVPDRQADSVLELGVAAGPWTTAIDGTPDSGISTSDFSVVISDLFAKDGKTRLIVTHNVSDADYRVVAFDDAGQVYHARNTSATGVPGAVQSDFVFSDSVSPEHVQRLEFQVRDYEWRKVPGIRLQPIVQSKKTNRTNRSDVHEQLKTCIVVWQAIGDEEIAKILGFALDHSPRDTSYVLLDPVDGTQLLESLREARAKGAELIPGEPMIWLRTTTELGGLPNHLTGMMHNREQTSATKTETADMMVNGFATFTMDGDRGLVDLDVDAANARLTLVSPADRSTSWAETAPPLQSFRRSVGLVPGEAAISIAPMVGDTAKESCHFVVVQAVAAPEDLSEHLQNVVDGNRWVSDGPQRMLSEIREGLAWAQPGAVDSTRSGESGSANAQLATADHNNVLSPADIVVAIGRPNKWPYRWWDTEGRPVLANPAWQRGVGSDTQLAVVERAARARGSVAVEFRFPDQPEMDSGTGVMSSSDFSEDTNLIVANKDEMDSYLNAGDRVDLAVTMGQGPWSEIGAIREGETIEADGGVFRLNEVEAQRTRTDRWFGTDIPGLVLIDGRYDYDPAWDIALVVEDHAGNRSEITTSHGSGQFSKREDRRWYQHIEMDKADIATFVILKRPVTELVIQDLPTEPGSPPTTKATG